MIFLISCALHKLRHFKTNFSMDYGVQYVHLFSMQQFGINGSCLSRRSGPDFSDFITFAMIHAECCRPMTDIGCMKIAELYNSCFFSFRQMPTVRDLRLEEGYMNKRQTIQPSMHELSASHSLKTASRCSDRCRENSQLYQPYAIMQVIFERPACSIGLHYAFYVQHICQAF